MDSATPRLDRLSNIHSIAEQILQRITLLQGFVIRFQGMTLAEQTGVDPTAVKREHLDPLFGLAGAFFELDQAEGGRILDPFIAAAHSLGLDSSRRRFRNIEWSSVHGLVVQVCGHFLLLWNRAFDPQSRIIIPVANRLQRFMGEAYACLADFNPTPYKTDLDREYLAVSGRPPAGEQPSPDELAEGLPPAGNRIQPVAEVWHLRYQDESGEYPMRNNQSIGWLAKLLARPNRCLTVAELRGDPEGKLAADAQLGGEHKTDKEGIGAIRERLVEIEDIIAETGGGERLEDEQAALLRQLQAAEDEERFSSPLRAAHHNIASQLRKLVRKKLARDMPQLAAHLKAALKLHFPLVGYYPPADTPAWKI